MKLKKIAALALAGVMAVSMLAGCGTDKKPGSGEGEGEGTVTTTGYSATLKDELDLDAKKYDYITFADNASDEAALKEALEYLDTAGTKTFAKSQVKKVWGTGHYADLLTGQLTKSLKIKGNMQWLALDPNDNINSDGVKDAVLYVCNGAVSDEAFVKQVAQDAALTSRLPSTDWTPDSVSGAYAADYTYTVSVSVAHKVVGDADASFALVTITRDSSAN